MDIRCLKLLNEVVSECKLPELSPWTHCQRDDQWKSIATRREESNRYIHVQVSACVVCISVQSV